MRAHHCCRELDQVEGVVELSVRARAESPCPGAGPRSGTERAEPAAQAAEPAAKAAGVKEEASLQRKTLRR
jgi:hypothetical protein